MLRKSRKPHRKTRTGCTSCKKGKVKCNEEKPKCGFCVRHGYECVYLIQSVSSNFKTTGLIPSPNASPAPIQTNIPQLMSGAPEKFRALDLELLHLYTSSTCFTFSKRPENQEIWQHVVPRLAFANDFLLQSILGISAVHLSRLVGDRRVELRAAASIYHWTAIAKFRLARSQVSLANLHACCVFILLINIHKWGSVESGEILFFPDPAGDLLVDPTEWLHLLRGGTTLIDTYRDQLISGPVCVLFSWDGEAKDSAAKNPDEVTRFEAQTQLWNCGEPAIGTLEIAALEEALKLLMTMYTMISSPTRKTDTVSIALAWLTQIPEKFISMLRERQSTALVLLAHYCLVLNRIDDFWWMEGISRNLLHNIYNAIGDEMRTWISWPLQDIALNEFRKRSAEIESSGRGHT